MQLVRESQPDPQRRRLLRQASWITLAGNLALATGKGAVAYVSGSVAIYADAANSVSDLAYSLLMVLGLWAAQRPPDLSHPQGHSRFEPLAGLVVAAAMTLAGYEAARVAIGRFLEGGTAVVLGWPTAAVLLAAAVKAGMYIVVRRIGRRAASSTLDAAAKDNLADVLTSTTAFLGILSSQYIHPLADAAAGALVAVWIFRAAFGVWRENLAYLTGGGASAELREQIAEAAQSVHGIVLVHQVITEHVGPQLVADLHVNVDGNITLFEAHAISDEVRERVEALQGIERAYVHLEPCKVVSPTAYECEGGAPVRPAEESFRTPPSTL